MTTTLVSCARQCYGLAINPISPYSNPVWHPGGSILGFNLTPLKSVGVVNPCGPIYVCDYYYDSAGFYLINADGSNKHRALPYQLESAAWSPDGRWMAFCSHGQIQKMPFDGVNFDTTQIQQLTTDAGSHFGLAWSPAGDSIYYDVASQSGPASSTIWKMAADGSGSVDIGHKGPDSLAVRRPYCTPTNEILHLRYAPNDGISNPREQIFIMNTNGDSVRQLTTTNDFRAGNNNPSYFDGHLYFQDFGIFSVSTTGNVVREVVPNSALGFSISKNGVIAYVNFGWVDTARVDHTHGTIWTVNVDGSNCRPFTFNYY